MKRILIGLFVLAAACSRRHDETTLTSAKIDAAPGQQSLEDLARSWDRAMSQRDLSLLAPVYGSTVMFHGVPLRHDQVIQVQSDGFEKDPSFTEELKGVRVKSDTRVELDREFVRFSKKHKATMWLEGKRENDRMVVTALGDGDAKPGEFCETLALQVALSTTKAGALLQGPPGNVHAVIVARPPEFPGYAVAMVTPVNGQPTVADWYDVEPCFLYSPAPNVRGAPGVCVPPGAANAAVNDVFTGEVLAPDPKLVTQMSKCPQR